MRVGTADPPQVSFCSVLRSVLAQFGMVGQQLVRGRNPAEHGDAVPLDLREGPRRLEALLEHDGGALEDDGQGAHAERGGVEERRDHEGDVGRDDVVVDEAVDRDPGEVPCVSTAPFALPVVPDV